MINIKRGQWYNEGENNCNINEFPNCVGCIYWKLNGSWRQKNCIGNHFIYVENDVSPHKIILENVKVSPSTLSYHLNKLIKKDIIELNIYGEDRVYRIKNRNEIVSLLIQYKPYKILDGFEEIWADLTV